MEVFAEAVSVSRVPDAPDGPDAPTVAELRLRCRRIIEGSSRSPFLGQVTLRLAEASLVALDRLQGVRGV